MTVVRLRAGDNGVKRPCHLPDVRHRLIEDTQEGWGGGTLEQQMYIHTGGFAVLFVTGVIKTWTCIAFKSVSSLTKNKYLACVHVHNGQV